jgi:hypothetical protein
MKLSKLRSLCDKAIEKYGDINVGSYSKDYAFDVLQEEDMRDFKIRILSGGKDNLPGDPLGEEEDNGKQLATRFACIFSEY